MHHYTWHAVHTPIYQWVDSHIGYWHRAPTRERMTGIRTCTRLPTHKGCIWRVDSEGAFGDGMSLSDASDTTTIHAAGCPVCHVPLGGSASVCVCALTPICVCVLTHWWYSDTHDDHHHPMTHHTMRMITPNTSLGCTTGSTPKYPLVSG